MITFHLSTEVTEDRRVILNLPPETPLGETELRVTIEPRQAGDKQGGGLRRHFGAVRSGDPRSGDNDRIDADLARAYQADAEETT